MNAGVLPDRKQVRILVTAVTGFLALFILPYMVYVLYRMGMDLSIDVTEGWNLIHTTDLLLGRNLYVPMKGLPITPVNYPPLSFFITAGLSPALGSLLLTGRVLSLISFLMVLFFIARIILRLTGSRLSGLAGALFSAALILRTTCHYVGMYDPQMMGHLFSLAAFALFLTKSKKTLGPDVLTALLIGISLFVKHLLIPVPLTLTVWLLMTDRRRALRFILLNTAVIGIFFWCSYLYGGEAFLSNFLDLKRPASLLRLARKLQDLFLNEGLFVLGIPFLAMLFHRNGRRGPALLYCVFSFLLAVYSVRGYGVDRNAFFDLFIAAGILFGLWTGVILSCDRCSGSKSLPLLILGVLCLWPFVWHMPADLREDIDFSRRHRDQLNARDIGLLRRIAGPALYQDMLLGHFAGKTFWFDPFAGAQMIVNGTLSEDIILEPIRRQHFQVIVFYDRLEQMLPAGFDLQENTVPPRTSVNEQWTDNTLREIARHYTLLDKGYTGGRKFYVPIEREKP